MMSAQTPAGWARGTMQRFGGLEGDLMEMNDPERTVQSLAPEQRPRTLAELGIRQAILEDLALKVLYLSGPMSTRHLSRHIRLGFDITSDLFTRMRSDLLCQVTGMSGNVPEIAITSQGRTRALELLAASQYAGAAPVSLESYVYRVREQSVRNIAVDEADINHGFAHLVIDDRTLEQIGTAINSGAAIFLYGPSGVGKTAIAETISNVLAREDIWIPYAVEVDGQIIAVFDTMVHQPVEVRQAEVHDERWIRCHRPSVMVGGELTIEMLDLQFNPSTKFYAGPVQMKANNGVLILDDFGRQRVRPEELLNRWVVPLDRGIDFLSLAGGRKIEIPFEMLVVFATNMDPTQLVDTAFLRRIQTKIKIDSASDDQFREIFHRVAAAQGLEVNPGLLNDLIGEIRGRLHEELRGCHPRDLINQICWTARYKKRKPTLDRESLTKAVEAYFLPHA
jgi:predicted ATPase with chaperone activity